VRNYLCLLGWSPKDNREVISIEDVVAKFDLPDIGRANARFDRDKLFWINGEYMRAATVDSLVPLAHHILNAHGIKTEGVDPAYFRAALAIVKEKIKLGRELPEWMGYFFTEDFSFDEAPARKVFTPEGLAHLAALQARLAGLDAAKFTAAALENEFKALAAASGQKVGAYIHPARLATSGRPVGPSLYHLLEVLGRERVLNRIDRALQQFGAGA
jgi:glutamyl-tRNA synthetase